MGQDSKIEWCHHTANLWWGCVEVSPACDHCYAREWAKRYDRAKWGAKEPRMTIKGVWKDLQKFQRNAAAAGEVHRVFVGSMMDIFEKPMPIIDNKGELVDGVTTGHLRDGFFEEVVPACPNLLFLLLTKRAGNIPKMIPPAWLASPPDNVMFGTSIGTQEDADREVPKLLKAPGRRFLSIEPLIKPVELRFDWLAELHWAIVGGESGHGARPMHPDWARGLRDRCVHEGVPFLFKQWGEWAPAPPGSEAEKLYHAGGPKAGYFGLDGQWKDWHRGGYAPFMARVGKKAAGRMLDGRTWDEFPASPALVV